MSDALIEFGLLDKLDQFQRLEYPQHPEKADDQQVLGSRNKDAEIGWQNGQKVDNPVKTDRITSPLFRCAEPDEIFDGEEDGEEPFKPVEQWSPGVVNRPDRVEHHHGDAHEDRCD